MDWIPIGFYVVLAVLAVILIASLLPKREQYDSSAAFKAHHEHLEKVETEAKQKAEKEEKERRGPDVTTTTSGKGCNPWFIGIPVAIVLLVILAQSLFKPCEVDPASYGDTLVCASRDEIAVKIYDPNQPGVPTGHQGFLIDSHTYTVQDITLSTANGNQLFHMFINRNTGITEFYTPGHYGINSYPIPQPAQPTP
jgi:hypothetical protein